MCRGICIPKSETRPVIAKRAIPQAPLGWVAAPRPFRCEERAMTGPYRGDPQFREVRRENCQEVVTVLSFLSDLPPVAVWPASHSSADPLDCPGLKPRCQRFLRCLFRDDARLLKKLRRPGVDFTCISIVRAICATVTLSQLPSVRHLEDHIFFIEKLSAMYFLRSAKAAK